MDDNYRHSVDEKKIKFRQNMLNTGKENTRWIVLITLVSFFTSASLLFISSRILENINYITAAITVLVIILIGILFDIIGIAVTAADETPFHAMASRKVYGAKQSIKLIRNANKVSNFCNDVVGDICGVISGTASAMIILKITVGKSPVEASIAGLIVSGMVAAVTVGGKALGKTFAIRKSNYIIYKVSIILQFLIERLNLKNNKNNERKK